MRCKGFEFLVLQDIIKWIKKHENLIDFVMFGMRFLTNFETFIYIIFLKGITNKSIYFSLTQNGSKKEFVTLEENKTKTSFKIGQKLQ